MVQAQTSAPRMEGDAALAAARPGKAETRKAREANGHAAAVRREGDDARPRGKDRADAAGSGRNIEERFAAFFAKARSREPAADNAATVARKDVHPQAMLLKRQGLGSLAVNLDLAGTASAKGAASNEATAKEGGVSPGKTGLPAAEGGKAADAALALKPQAKDAEAGKPELKKEAEESPSDTAKEPQAETAPRSDNAALALASSALATKEVTPRAAVAADGEAKVLSVETKDGAKPEGKADVPKVSVSDLRKKDGRHAVKAGDQGDAGSQPADGSADPRTKDLDLDLGTSNSIGQGGTRQDSGTQGTRSDQPAAARDFSQVLADRLRDSWNGDIVKSAQVILREGDSGTIRLKLHPDNLGGVKIELQLADNCISGKIIVESEAAKSAFERNIAQLQDAFRQGGFESARLDVQVGGGNAGNQQGKGADGTAQPFWSDRRGAETLAKAVPEASGPGHGARSRSGVDLLA